MAFNLDECETVNPNLILLLCEENTNVAFFADLETDHHHQKRRRTHQVGPGLEAQKWFFPLLQSDETVRTMVERERELLPRSDYLKRLRSGDLDLSVRREALDWIWKAYYHYSFGPVCICLATNYLDRFLSVYDLPRGKAWTVQLLAVACLSLAAKMDETNVPQSVDLQVGDPKFLFEAKTIRRMELLVLNTLKWRMLAFTACSFVDHFLRKIIPDDDRILPSLSSFCRSSQLILAMIGGIDFLEFRPSEIAASVAISISGEIKAVDIDRAISSFIYVEKERVLKCLELMKDLSSTSISRFTSNTRSGSISASASASTSIPQSPVGVLEAASLSYNNNSNGRISNNDNDIERDALTIESRENSSTQITSSASTFTTTATMTITSITETNKKRRSEAFI